MFTHTANDEVMFVEESIVSVGHELIDFLKKQACRNSRKRMRLCTHRHVGDKLHEMFIALHSDVYIRPHKHLNKAESFHVIEGIVDVILFNDDGSILDIIHMGNYNSGSFFYYRIDISLYHTLIVRSDVLVFHETTTGPFTRTDTDFALWAPDDHEDLDQKLFKEDLEKRIKYFYHD